jgi:N-acetylmuramoyl-L-alanine amidase
MNITQNFLPVGSARPGKTLTQILAIVLHWPADPGATATQIRNYWAGPGNTAGASAHCAIDQDGIIVQVMPWNEKAYHVGSSQIDPASGKIYTDLARSLFGVYASNPQTSSPNNCTIGIEMCHADMTGSYTGSTVEAAAELCAMLCREYKLDPVSKIVRHVDVVGWKQCPKWYIDHPNELDAFRQSVKQKIVL